MRWLTHRWNTSGAGVGEGARPDAICGVAGGRGATRAGANGEPSCIPELTSPRSEKSHKHTSPRSTVNPESRGDDGSDSIVGTTGGSFVMTFFSGELINGKKGCARLRGLAGGVRGELR